VRCDGGGGREEGSIQGSRRSGEGNYKGAVLDYHMDLYDRLNNKNLATRSGVS